MSEQSDDIACYLNLTPPFNDANFLQLARITSTHCMFAHVRASAVEAKYNSLSNCHPFVLGKFLYMHNGGIAHFKEVQRALLNTLSQEAFETIHGTTDSEVLGAMMMDALHEVIERNESNCSRRPKDVVYMSDLKAAILLSIQRVLRTLGQMKGDSHSASSLNLCVTTSEFVVACRFRDAMNEPPSLYYRREEGFLVVW
jgi:glutamine amidotransferase